MGNRKIVVVGSSNVDLIMKMDHLPSKGETVTNASFQQVYGGKGANQAVAAARAGGQVTFISCVGKDAYTPQMVENYDLDGIDSRFVFREEGISSGYALIMVDSNGENYISVAPEANNLLSPKKIDKARTAFDGARLIVMQYEIPEQTIKYVIDVANSMQIPVLWNMAPARTFDISYLKKIQILILNQVEAGFLSGIQVNDVHDAEKAGNKLIEAGISTVIVTLGTNGSILLRDNQTLKVPAFKVKALDTTAAGDTFCGAFAVAFLEGNSAESALQFASAAAALCVTRVGAQPSIPLRKEINDFLKNEGSSKVL